MTVRAAARTHRHPRLRMLLAAVSVLAAAGGLRAENQTVDPKTAEELAKQAAEAEFARYRPFSVTWARRRDLKGVAAVFPHPAVPSRAALVTDQGLLLSDDAGKTFEPAGAAAPERLGRITHVAYRPDRAETFYLATSDRGVWVTEDAGKTFRQIGSKRLGLAFDAVERVIVWPDDPHFRTLYVFHGRAGEGISRSFNGGRTWGVVSRGYHVRWAFPTIVGWGDTVRIFVIASAKARPEMETAFSCSALDDLWSESFRDIVYNDGAMAFSRKHIYVATADRGLYRVSPAGAERVGPPGVAGFASVGVTWGPRADKELVYAYEPRKLGLLVSMDGMRTCTAHSRGLYVGPFVRQGAHIRATASGGRFFAVVNGSLYTGFVRTRGLSVTQASVAPAVFTYRRTDHEKALAAFHEELREFRRRPSAAAAARALLARHAEVRKTFQGGALRITARAFALRDKPKSVTVDLSGLQGPPDQPMCDDGKHDDGDANDGVYGARFHIDPRNLRDPRSRQPLATGRHALSIKAEGQDGSIGGAVAVLSTYDRPERLVLWSDGPNPLRKEAGDVEIPKQPHRDEAFYANGCMKLDTGDKPWAAAFDSGRQPTNIAGYYALSFWVRTDRGRELNVQLCDAPEFDLPTTAGPTAVVAGKLVEGGKLADEYRRVVIPLGPLLTKAPGFRVTRLGQVIFSGDAEPPATFWIDKLVLHVNAESVENERKAPRDPAGRRRR